MSAIKSFFSKENFIVAGGIIVGFMLYNKVISKYIS